MKKLIPITLALTCLMTTAIPAMAADYDFPAPEPYDYAKASSIEVIHTADGGAAPNVDRSKNAALIPPAFGSASAYAIGTGEYLTPNLTEAGNTARAVINGSSAPIIAPGTTTVVSSNDYTPTSFTSVSAGSYYANGSLGRLSIPVLGLNVKIVQGTDSTALAKGIGHFEDSSIWDGNVALAAHNRGTNSYFGQIHTLNVGDKITLTTKSGVRTYAVTSVAKVAETDRSSLDATAENVLTLYTCVRNERDYRWCVRAVEIV